MQTKDIIKKLYQKAKTKNVWRRAVATDAIDLIEHIGCPEKLPTDYLGLQTVLLDGAKDWTAYSKSGRAYIYDIDIAAHYLDDKELKKIMLPDGSVPEYNGVQTWDDVQAQALWEAFCLINTIIQNNLLKSIKMKLSAQNYTVLSKMSELDSNYLIWEIIEKYKALK